MRTLTISTLTLTALACLACHGGPTSNAEGGGVEPVAGHEQDDQARATPKPRDRSVALTRGVGHRPHEVELDPRGEVALTLDAHGGVRLWPAVRSGDPELASPYVLPFDEPLWMSVAQADDGFVVGIIDTSNAGQVALVSPAAGDRGARLTPLFAIPPADPLLELHVLDGGRRILALGVDHRVRLYDRAGALVSVIDERSFGPWQLRVVHAQDSAQDSPKIAAMLAQPLRVQAIALHDDALALVGEPRPVTLDRGPNRNDLALSPDGKTVAALRRRRARGQDFSIELIDLETDARRLVAGRTDSTVRPRMHFVDAGRILLETGSNSGRGLWVELAKATALSDPADADPDSKLAKRLYGTKHDMIPLAASAEHRPVHFDPKWDKDFDRGERDHASVVAGVRVNVERLGVGGHETALIVDPLASDRHLVLRSGPRRFSRSALDHEGELLAWASGERLGIARIDGSHLEELEHGLAPLIELAFTDDSRILLVDEKGGLVIYEWPTAQEVTSTKLDYTWAIEGIAYRPSEAGSGVLGYRSGKPGVPVRMVEIAANRIGPITELGRAERPLWLEILELGDSEAAALLGLSERDADDHLDEYGSDARGRLFYTTKADRIGEVDRTPLFVRVDDDTQAWPLPAGQGRRIVPSPDGSRVAVVQFRGGDELLSVLDGETGERLWTIGDPGSLVPRWSADGRRLTVNLEVHDAATGELLFSAREAPLVIEDRADADWASQNVD